MNNIKQMKVLIGQLEALGQAEVADQIQALKTKVAELEAERGKIILSLILFTLEEAWETGARINWLQWLADGEGNKTIYRYIVGA
jgi:hypothetical protein